MTSCDYNENPGFTYSLKLGFVPTDSFTCGGSKVGSSSHSVTDGSTATAVSDDLTPIERTQLGQHWEDLRCPLITDETVMKGLCTCENVSSIRDDSENKNNDDPAAAAIDNMCTFCLFSRASEHFKVSL